ncbi:hypothetical protein GCM10011515_20600 [Tsuneonella deserti]|uniref:Uncharacterized protein n=1 Tax=Tsuneonella deserti TaxID=2035528 RepID=A0ABQ1SCI8_9SPHN|nr:hypothetical protein [Tsuneonella deserti]GGE00693.1 hypothetical protein GCM10011515_20600 [Tsuneonella deserti]
MNTRARIILSALLGSAVLASAMPAQAQVYSQNHDRYEQRRDYNDRYDRYDRYDRGEANAIRVQIEQLEQRVRHLDNRDRISEREAATLRRAASDLRYQYRNYARDGLSRGESRILRDRIQRLHQRVAYERRDNDGRRW